MLHGSKPLPEPKCCGAAIFAAQNVGSQVKETVQDNLTKKYL